MREKTIQVDGQTVTLIKFTAAPGFRMLARLTKLVGGSVLEVGKAAGKDKDGQAAAFGEVLDGILLRIEPDQLYQLINDILCSGFVSINRTKITHLDDLGQFEDSDPFYMGLTIAKEQLMFSFADSLKKLIAPGS